MEALLSVDVRKGSRRPPLWWVRLSRYEYWPFWILFAPAFFYWLYLSWKARSFSYFSAVNPGIELGGIFGESKSTILDKIQARYKPDTCYIKRGEQLQEVLLRTEQAGIRFPLICKPDKGEMGYRVEKVANEIQLLKYIQETPVDFIVQEFISYPTELGILYYRFPDGRSGITSVVTKEFLAVTGDGNATVEALMQQSDRARLQLAAFRKNNPGLLQTIVPQGENRLLEPIGNHCRGTRFMNGNSLINNQLVQVFDEIAGTMEGFYYGRFDLKVGSIPDLYEGKNIRIMEVNGCTSEPAHIYDREMTLWKAYKDVFQNMKIMQAIALANHQAGAVYVSPWKILTTIRKHFTMKKNG